MIITTRSLVPIKGSLDTSASFRHSCPILWAPYHHRGFNVQMAKVILNYSHLRYLHCTNQNIWREIESFLPSCMFIDLSEITWIRLRRIQKLFLYCHYMLGSEACLPGHRMVSLILRITHSKAGQVSLVWSNIPPWRLNVFYNMDWADIQWRRNPINFK